MNKINVTDFKGMLRSACANLENYASEIDTLNVFPVPDGDTGTNMSMTFTNGYNEVAKCDSDSVTDAAKIFSRGLLMGARGNSGVITSQIFRGFYQSIEGKDELSVGDISLAFENGARVAYKAIMKPVEGTILTVIREASWYANHDYELEPFDLDTYFEKLVQYSKESLDRTPDYLPVLKEVGVVDSGGSGLLRILEGMLLYVKGSPVEFNQSRKEVQVNPALLLENEEFGYCTEFIIRLNNVDTFDERKLKTKLTDMGGESLVVVKDDDLVKVHVHTLKPGDVLNTGQRYGEFIKLKIENMQEQHSSITTNNIETKQEVTRKKYGIITVGAGEGIVELFKELGADRVVEGGQTMNPSTEDFINVIEELDYCDNIFIYPNNSNIILAANQARDVCSDRNIYVLESKSVQAGISGVGFFNYDGDVDDILAEQKEIIDNVTSASVTYAIKDTQYEGLSVKANDFISMADKKIIASDKDIRVSVTKLLDYLISKDKEILTIIEGKDASKQLSDYIVSYINDHSKLEVSIIEGKQPVYTYLFGLE